MKRRTKENFEAIAGLIIIIAVLGIAVSLWNLSWVWALRFAIMIGVAKFFLFIVDNIFYSTE